MKEKEGKRIRWNIEITIDHFKKEIVPNVDPLTKSNIMSYSNKFYLAIQRSNEITWSELFAIIGLNFDEIHKNQRKIGNEKYWVREKLIQYFANEILPNNKGLKRRDLVKEYNHFCRGMDNSKEITWSELYALFNLDYEAIKREPAYWNRARLIEFMLHLIKIGEPVNLTALSNNHESFYKALMRSKEITVEELCKICGLDYKLVRREKKYKTDDDARQGLINLFIKGISLYKAKYVRKDQALYKYLLERGNGNLQRGMELVGFKVTKDNSIPKILISNLIYSQILGHHFQKVVSDIFNILRLGIRDNIESINGLKPDFFSKKDGTWYDAKISTRAVYDDILDGRYAETAKKVVYVYLENTKELNAELLPVNVEIVHVYKYVEMIKNRQRKEHFLGKLSLLSDLYKHFVVRDSQKKTVKKCKK
ncbi:hypothetical protein QGM71_12500 [Virgibacillus sp. C22-A2]|uniref:Restriction endonuclease n=1 Tax=Virgibacillus tibetensis TaxID=3042313 RepID=A0ABU6KG71_9BACI|nr:hypothetical protein [Virgibacillus sp. C22-A2]